MNIDYGGLVDNYERSLLDRGRGGGCSFLTDLAIWSWGYLHLMSPLLCSFVLLFDHFSLSVCVGFFDWSVRSLNFFPRFGIGADGVGSLFAPDQTNGQVCLGVCLDVCLCCSFVHSVSFLYWTFVRRGICVGPQICWYK